MSGHQYITDPNNLYADDDIDDDTFLKNSRVNSQTNPFEQEKQCYEQKREQIEARTLEASQRSLGLLYETEEVGKATANELSKQREQLEKSSRQLDEISATLRFSQKHLNGLKSVFGGLKNYLSGNRDMLPPGRITGSPSGSKISEEEINESKLEISAEDRYNSHPVNRIRNGPLEHTEHNVKSSKAGFNQKLEENLDDMCGSLSRLKGLATDLQGEIESQNDLLDNMTYKMEDVDIKVGKQNKEMNKLLGKNKK